MRKTIYSLFFLLTVSISCITNYIYAEAEIESDPKNRLVEEFRNRAQKAKEHEILTLNRHLERFKASLERKKDESSAEYRERRLGERGQRALDRISQLEKLLASTETKELTEFLVPVRILTPQVGAIGHLKGPNERLKFKISDVIDKQGVMVEIWQWNPDAKESASTERTALIEGIATENLIIGDFLRFQYQVFTVVEIVDNLYPKLRLVPEIKPLTPHDSDANDA